MLWSNLQEAISSGWLEHQTFRSLYFSQKALVESAQELKAIRRHRRLSQAELAQRIGSTQQSISRWERGAIGNVSLAFLAKVAAALEVEPEIGFKEYQNQNPT